MTDNGKTSRTQAKGAWVVHINVNDSAHALALFGSEIAAYRYANPLHAQVVFVGFGSEIPGAKTGQRAPRPGSAVTEPAAEPAEVSP